MARLTVVGLVAAAAALGLGSPLVSAQEVPPVNSPELDALNAAWAPLGCPALPSATAKTLNPFATGVRGQDNGNGVVDVPDEIQMYCSYQPLAVPGQPNLTITFDVALASSEVRPICLAEPTTSTDNGLTVRDSYPLDGPNVSLTYSIGADVLAAVPGIEAEILGAITPQLDFFVGYASLCQVAPIAVTCPPIAGLTLGEPRPADTRDLFETWCDYSDETRGINNGDTSLYLSWASERSSVEAIQYSCYDPGDQVIPTVGDIIAPGQSAAVVWLSASRAQADIEAVRTAGQAALDQVLPQATTCEGALIEPMWTPLPAYLAETYAPERIAGPAINTGAIAAPAAVPVPVTTTPAASATSTTVTDAALTPPEPTTTAATTATNTPASIVDTASVASPTSSGGLLSTVFRVMSIVMLIVSILGVALAFLLMRRETRVRPRLDIARIVIVIVVAAASILLLAKEAPVGPALIAVGVGLGIGYLQGSNLAVRSDGVKIYAKRSGLALLAFAASLVITQFAGWANRTGVLALGLAMSFLSAAMTGGLIAGRSPKLAKARQVNVATALVMILAAGVVLASLAPSTGRAQSEEPPPAEPAPAEPAPLPIEQRPCGKLTPAERCAATEHLMSLIDWTQIELEVGLHQRDGKPPLIIDVPFGLDAPPADVVRTVDWVKANDDGTTAETFNLTEAITFGLDEDGICCTVAYDGSGTTTNQSGEVVASQMTGPLHDLEPVGGFVTAASVQDGSGTQGLPFTGAQRIGVGDDATCARYVGGSGGSYSREATLTTLIVRGEDLTTNEDRVKDAALTALKIPCEIPGFTMAAAMEMAPAVAGPPAGCPTRKDLYQALTDGGVEVTATETIADTFLTPTDHVCGEGSLFSPLTFGGDGRGEQRSEFAFEYATPETATVWGDDSALFSEFRPSATPVADRCPVDELGRPLPVVEGQRCALQTMHVLDDGWISIEYDNQLSDGPNTRIRASLPWGTYWYRCHHCQPDDPEVTRFLGQFHDFSTDYAEQAAAAVATAIDEAGAPVTTVAPSPDNVSTTEPQTQLEQEAEALGVDPELAELFVDPDDDADERAAALAALVGLIGTMGLAGTALTESGLSASEVASRFREGGIGGINEALDEREAERAASAVVDERGETLFQGDDGLYEWDTGDESRRVSRDELDELIAEARRASDHDRARHEAFVRDNMSDAGAAERFDALGERSIAQNDELMQDIRDGWDRVDELESTLERRGRALADLELSEAAQALADAQTSLDQIALQTALGAGRDIAGLPGEIVDATRAVVTTVADPENWRIVAEGTLETIYDIAGATIGGGSFGDAHESVADGMRVGAQVAVHLGTHPLDTIAMITPIQDLSDSLDGDRSLGQRLGSLGMALVDIGGTLTGLGVLSNADELADLARLADRASEAAGASTDANRALQAAEALRNAERTGDAGLGVARVADADLGSDLLQTRDRIRNTILAAQEQAQLSGRPMSEIVQEMPEVRDLFRNGGMRQMGELEAAGGLSDEMARAVVNMHDEITEAAVRTGTNNAIDDMLRLDGVRPQQVLVGNSGSVGAARSVVTDADRTLVTVFSDADLDRFRAPITGMTRPQAAAELQSRFTSHHIRQVELGLNSPSDPAVRLARELDVDLSDAVGRLQRTGSDNPLAARQRLMRADADMDSYAGFGSLTGPDDSYPAGFTQARQSIQGSTDVYRVRPDGSIRRHAAGADAIIDQHEIERFRHTGSTTRVPVGSYVDANGDVVNVFDVDPRRIPPAELAPLLEQQVKAVDKYNDVKSVSKAVERMRYVAGRRGQPMANQALVDAAVAIRQNPRSSVDVLKGLGKTDEQFVADIKDMVASYGRTT